ncbi:protein mateRNAl effect lethal 26 [Anaeramoeba ignava]|uniref:Protein mateRNAl effect lethal 26 n=1 Tax=Anaeramoeba ignava TaxID=1746090 RepID=A0A9Q0LUD1_ANAIG|nr:protein mateRNAl effect lethal 26 [Anaeramoeba ignava]
MIKFIRGEFTDSQVETIEEPVKFHKQVFNFRLSTVSLEKLGDVCQKQHKEDVVNFFSWIYSGIANNKFSIKNILKELGVKEEDFESKSGKNGLISDFKKLFEDDDSKEFRIVVEEKEVKIHKFVLIARTDLFRGMFLNVVDDSNFVGEYSASVL